MHILITGGTGFIGSALVPALLNQGHQLTVLSRTTQGVVDGVSYIPDFEDVGSPVDAVINLSGASLADKRWSPAYKTEIRDSRIGVTQRLVDWMGRQAKPPHTLLSGSAIGYYGDSDTAIFDETSPVGNGFAATLCRDWEAAALAAQTESTRVVLMRLGVVLDKDGGAFVEMTRSFAVGVGSWLGSGNQWLSWIHRKDAVEAMLFLLERPEVSGPVNLTAPGAVTHKTFCAAVAAQRKTLFSAPVPGFLIRTLVGEMADELLLSGQRVAPEVLLQQGFSFALPEVQDAVAKAAG